MRFYFLVTGLFVYSMLFAGCGMLAPQKPKLATHPGVDVPRNMSHAETDAGIDGDDALYVSLLYDRTLYVGDQQYSEELLSDAIRKRTKERPTMALYFQAPYQVDYEKVVQVFDSIRKTDAKELSLVVDAKPEGGSGNVSQRFKISLPAEPTDMDKPAPLYLEVNLGKDGKITVNKDSLGTVDEPEKLIAKLTSIFAERAANPAGKALTIRPTRSNRYVDVVKLVDIVKGAGAGPISLAIDDLVD